MKCKTTYYAKPKAVKIAAITCGKTLKQVAKDTTTHYNSLVMIAGGKVATSKLRAEAIASSVNAEFDSLFVAKK
ncbi:hypothetical protein [Staphylococcus hominis]|uniref:hypothetical protein n=1 Tax=Staphylococcus hominis TaxID=1290 RepID=UPI000D1F4FEC|nr:hypothetical protein [Staphylococcus hominis]PTK37691.1 hypothetical protein BUZ45_03050 [Staphylococcus hominis]